MVCDYIYIDETGRTTRVRCLEHKSHARCKRTDHSAAADHVLLEGHKTDFDNPVVPILFCLFFSKLYFVFDFIPFFRFLTLSFSSQFVCSKVL